MTTFRKPHWKVIQDAVAKEYGIERADLVSKRRSQAEVKPRHVAMYLTRQLTSYSLPMIGRLFGGRNHTSIMHALDRVDYRLSTEPAFLNQINKLKSELEKHLTETPDSEFVDSLAIKGVRSRLKYLLTLTDHNLIDELEHRRDAQRLPSF